LVFPLSQRTCNLYSQSATGAHGPCGNSVSGSSNSASPNPIGAIRAINYRDGHSCSLTPSPGFLSRYTTYEKAVRQRLHIKPGVVTQRQVAAMQAATRRFLASQHLTTTGFEEKMGTYCPPVGYAAPKAKRLTRADVATGISVGPVSTRSEDAGATITFTAKQPVSSSDSWYEFAAAGPSGCQADQNGPVGYGNVHTGQRLTTRISISAACKGTIHGEVGYMQHSSPTNTESAGSGGTPGKDGSIVVGHFTFTVK
jgi:hypothetical protein